MSEAATISHSDFKSVRRWERYRVNVPIRVIVSRAMKASIFDGRGTSVSEGGMAPSPEDLPPGARIVRRGWLAGQRGSDARSRASPEWRPPSPVWPEILSVRLSPSKLQCLLQPANPACRAFAGHRLKARGALYNGHVPRPRTGETGRRSGVQSRRDKYVEVAGRGRA